MASAVVRANSQLRFIFAITILGQHRGGGPCGRGVRDPSEKHNTRK